MADFFAINTAPAGNAWKWLNAFALNVGMMLRLDVAPPPWLHKTA